MLRLSTGKMKWLLSDCHLSPVDWPVAAREDPDNDEEKYESCSQNIARERNCPDIALYFCHSDQMSQLSQVSKDTICFQIINWHSLTATKVLPGQLKIL